MESAEYNDDIQYDIEYEDTASMFQGEYRTKVKGDLGERFVEAEVYRVNGLEVGRIVTKEEILEEPTTKVVYRGTKDPPPRKGTGVFAKPTSVVTSHLDSDGDGGESIQVLMLVFQQEHQ